MERKKRQMQKNLQTLSNENSRIALLLLSYTLHLESSQMYEKPNTISKWNPILIDFLVSHLDT